MRRWANINMLPMFGDVMWKKGGGCNFVVRVILTEKVTFV